MKVEATFITLLSIAIASAFAQTPADLEHQFDQAESRIERLSPAAFHQLPGSVVRELQRRGCAIPQNFSKKPNNVIKGEFAKRGQTDWAALCSVNGASTILVFWNGSGKNAAELGALPDRNFLQGISAEEIAYSRGIAPVGKNVILRRYNAYGGPKPPPMEHEGIDDAFLEKGSSVWYFYEGNWLRLTGSD